MPLGLQTASLNFETLQEIGQDGKNSKVYIANDIQLDANIVIKKIKKIRIVDAEYFKESKLLYSSSHQNIVKVKYGCQDDEHIYIAMPYYKKGSLKGLLNSRFLTVREIIRYSLQFLSGLNHIHTKGLIHFDIKPDNILLSNSNEALLSDFGLTKAMNAFGFVDQEFAYPKQVPPERFTQTKFSIHYDIYLAGLTLYRLCNGNERFDAQLAKFTNDNDYIKAISNGSFPNRKDYLPHIPLGLRKAINTALDVIPIQRQHNILELMNVIGSINENIDWQYDGENIWKLDDDDRIHTVELIKKTDIHYNVLTHKTIKSSGNRTKVHSNCFENIIKKDILKSIEKALKLPN